MRGGARQTILRFFLYYFVQELETITIERQCQYSSLFGRLKADHCQVCELQ